MTNHRSHAAATTSQTSVKTLVAVRLLRRDLSFFELVSLAAAGARAPNALLLLLQADTSPRANSQNKHDSNLHLHLSTTLNLCSKYSVEYSCTKQ